MDNNGKKPRAWKELFTALKKIRKTHKIQSLHIHNGIKESRVESRTGCVTYEWDGTTSVTIDFMKKKK